MIIEHHELTKYIPHRHPFLLIDRVVEIEAFKKVVAIKNVTGSESFFAGHFPEAPVMPGVLIIEAMAQAAAVLATFSAESERGKIIFFAAIDNARFKKPVIPGDTLRLEITVDKTKSRLWKVRSVAFVGETLVCEADLTAMIQDKK